MGGRWARSRRPDQPGKRAAFEPLVPGVRFVPPNDVAALVAAVDDDVGLILVEPILGEGGVVPLDPEFLAAAASLPPLLALDEIQTGMGRTGSFFAFEQLGVRPDLVTLAKGLANGLPIGALLVADSAAGAFEPGDHGSTFGANPVSCAAACAVVDAIDDALLANVQEQGRVLASETRRAPRRAGGSRSRALARSRGRPPVRRRRLGLPRARADRAERRRERRPTRSAPRRRLRRRSEALST